MESGRAVRLDAGLTPVEERGKEEWVGSLRLCVAVLRTFWESKCICWERHFTVDPEHPCTLLMGVFKARLTYLLILRHICRAR